MFSVEIHTHGARHYDSPVCFLISDALTILCASSASSSAGDGSNRTGLLAHTPRGREMMQLIMATSVPPNIAEYVAAESVSDS